MKTSTVRIERWFIDDKTDPLKNILAGMVQPKYITNLKMFSAEDHVIIEFQYDEKHADKWSNHENL